MKKRMTIFLMTALLVTCGSSGSLLAADHLLKFKIAPQVGFAVDGDAVSYEVGAGVLSLQPCPQLELGLNLLGEGLNWRKSDIDNPDWALKAGVYALWHLRTGAALLPGLYLGASQNIGSDFNPFSLRAGVNLDLLNVKSWALALNTGYQWRDGFDYDAGSLGRLKVGSSNSYYLSFGLR